MRGEDQAAPDGGVSRRDLLRLTLGGGVGLAVGGFLDVPAMRAAARLLVGRRDFGPFSITGSEPATTVRTLRSLDVEEEGPVLVVTAIGDGFLRGMVRRLVGTLRDAGRGRIRPEEAPERPGPTAEARGLTLVRVLYEHDRPQTPASLEQ